MDVNEIWKIITTWLIGHGLKIILIIILTFTALKISRVLANRIFSVFKKTEMEIEMQKRADTLNSLIRYILNSVILAVSLVMILGELGIQIGPVLAAAGIVGLAVGFGAQQLVQDVISGFFILLEDQIRVGDVVQISGVGGLVEKVSLRLIVLRDLAGNVHYIRNGQVSDVTNMTKGYSQYVFDIGIAYRENVDEVMEVIKQVGEDLRSDPNFKDDILDALEILGLDSFAASSVVIKARIKTKPIQQWRIGREFNRRLKNKFDELNIEIPFPHMTVYMGEDKQGQAPPVRVSMVDRPPA
jgi:small-conductance mechanosensitive channel